MEVLLLFLSQFYVVLSCVVLVQGFRFLLLSKDSSGDTMVNLNPCLSSHDTGTGCVLLPG
jgi:hypothetical protein